jgi:ornithine cyclodeaminase/alanine dehydrogenase-like protein (mu-crystallin family)
MTEQTKPEFLFLQQEDVIAAGALDMEMVLDRVELVFKMFGRDEMIQPVKPLIRLPESGAGQRYLMVAMPVYMGGEINRAGIKWAAESKDNQDRGDLPYGIDVIILHDIQRAIPLAIMDGTVITAMRTGAAAGVAAKYLAPAGARVAGLVGAGVVGRTALEAIGLSVPTVKKFRVFDLNVQKSQMLQAEFGDRWEIEIVDSIQSAVDGADIISTQTTAKSPLVKAEWVKPGCFFAQVGSNEAEEKVVKQANCVVVDEIEMVKRYDSIPHRLYLSGELKESDMIHLSDVVLGRVTPRVHPEDRIIFLSHGMGSLDLAIADYIYRQAQAKNLGKTLSLWNKTDLKLG